MWVRTFPNSTLFWKSIRDDELFECSIDKCSLAGHQFLLGLTANMCQNVMLFCIWLISRTRVMITVTLSLVSSVTLPDRAWYSWDKQLHESRPVQLYPCPSTPPTPPLGCGPCNAGGLGRSQRQRPVEGMLFGDGPRSGYFPLVTRDGGVG